MIKPVISVVMPCYNVAKYLPDAIESIMEQTFKEWELVIVDDCSTDETLSVAHRYAALDGRIRVFHLEQNTGSAHIPRNKAVKEAFGEWIHCLDADDFVDKDCLEKLYKRAMETDADCIHQTFQSITESREILSNRLPAASFDFSQVISGEEACRMTIGGWKINANGGLIKKKHFYKGFA